MNLSEYQKAAARTFPNRGYEEDLKMAVMGLAGEVGEVAEPLKKWFYHGKPLHVRSLHKELGDVLWYLAAIATAMKFDLNEVAKENIKKLEERWPNGFSAGQDNLD